jgi:hypothetical protein
MSRNEAAEIYTVVLVMDPTTNALTKMGLSVEKARSKMSCGLCQIAKMTMTMTLFDP